MKTESFDLLIIGGGITGAGVARDAASRGMRVALVEANDFASGTSSRSSKLIHGGIRYLENLEFGLVFEALKERSLLFDMAPHLVHPLRFMLPIYKGFRVGRFKMGLGMWLYDVLSLFEAPQMHESLGSTATMKRSGLLKKEGLKGSFVYSDAYMDDDRLVIETLRSAHSHGAICANYVSAEGIKLIDNKISAVDCEDQLTGEKLSIKAKHIVSSVGPWTDQVASRFFPDWKSKMRPTKGVHLTFKRGRFPLKEAVVMAAEGEKRIVFGIPRNEMVIVGTTDTDFSGDPREVKTNKADVNYLLEVLDHYFPGASLKEEDIVASYSGIRPLVDDGSATEGKTSREHVILEDERGITFVTGGKYTTYRHMAEQTVETALGFFSQEERVKYSHSETKEPLNKKVSIDQFSHSKRRVFNWAKEFKLSPSLVDQLVERHGAEAYDILSKYLPRLTQVKGDDQILWSLEAHHAIDETMCGSLLDFYLRRTPLFLSMKDHGFYLMDLISSIFQKSLSFSDAEMSEQKNNIMHHLKGEMGWRSTSDSLI